jgi:hypothetical protein
MKKSKVEGWGHLQRGNKPQFGSSALKRFESLMPHGDRSLAFVTGHDSGLWVLESMRLSM